MRRTFKVNGVKFNVANCFTDGMEINKFNMKYNLMYFNEEIDGWMRVCSVNTLREAREEAECFLETREEAECLH